MLFAKVFDGVIVAYPYTWDAFVMENNNTMYGHEIQQSDRGMADVFPMTDMAKAGNRIAEVFPSSVPEHDPISQSVCEITPVRSSKGQYEQAYALIDLDPEVVAERKAAALLIKRTAMVATPWQISKALLAVGLLDDIEAAVAAADRVVQLGWARAQEFKRLDPLLVGLGQAIGKTEAELDSIFELAMSL